MASKRGITPAKQLFNGFRQTTKSQPNTARSMATIASDPAPTLSQTYADAHLSSAPTEPILTDSSLFTTSITQQPRPPNPFIKPAHVTLHSFPTLTPLTLHPYPSTHLLLPLRRDLLHRAIIYEGDATRQGSANSKHRTEIHGSNRKIRPQKGTGMARLGDKKSPMLRGGGAAFGPKPRSFATELPGKVYDLAWRTALSHRFRVGELVVLEDEAEIPVQISPGSRERWLRDLLRHNRMGHPDRRTLFVTAGVRERLFESLEREGREARALVVGDVDVKDLLELGRVCVERGALERILRERESDLAPGEKLRAWERRVRVGV